MSNNTKQTKSAVAENKIRKDLTFGLGKISNLEKISIDKTVGQLLTNVGGEINLSITGQASTVKVTVKEGDGTSSIVTLDEFVKVLGAPTRVLSIAKKRQAMLDEGSLRETIAHITWALGLAEFKIQPITSETLGLVKQSLVLMKTVSKNIETIELVVKKHPEDQFGDILTYYSNVTLKIVAHGIAALITKERTVSESNQHYLKEYELPAWAFSKLTAERVDAGVSPYLYFFPRKKGKGITVTTTELRRDEFLARNFRILQNSRVLISLIGTGNDFLEEVVTISAYIKDDVGKETLMRQSWNVHPPLEVGVDRFLELKEKTTIELEPDGVKGDLKKQLIKVNNALLRTSQLENSGPRPDVSICSELLTVEEDFNPHNGVNFYDAMRKVTGIEEVVADYLRAATTENRLLWCGLFCLEMKISNSDALRTAFNFSVNPEEKDDQQLKTVGEESLDEGEEKTPDEDGVDGTSEEKPKDKEDEHKKLTNHIIGIKPSMYGEVVKAWPFPPNSVMKDLVIFFSGQVDLKNIGYLHSERLKEGDPNHTLMTKHKTKCFSLIETDQKLATGKKKKPSAAHTPLSGAGRKITGFIREKISAEAAEDMKGFLCGFSSTRLQKEAVKRISAHTDWNLSKYIEDEASSFRDDEEDYDSDEGQYM